MSALFGTLYDEIASFANLHRAARIAAKGKRYRASAAEFLLRMESECLRLEEELGSDRWYPGGYRVFRVTDPKERTICAAPFRDRVVHQALVQVVEPFFERAFIHDSYACRRGKGTHAALERVAGWVRRYPWVLKLDVQKYFPSIDHAVAMALLEKKLACPRTLELFRRILATWRSEEAPLWFFPGDDLFAPAERSRGLPIGNLTSQFLANVVLDAVDHRVKDGLGVRAYARYCDDLVVCGESPEELLRVRAEIATALGRLRLVPHPRKTQVFPSAQGVSWVGFRVFPREVRLPRTGLRRARRRFRAFSRGRLHPTRARASIVAWIGHGRRGLRPRRLSDVVGLAGPDS